MTQDLSDARREHLDPFRGAAEFAGLRHGLVSPRIFHAGGFDDTNVLFIALAAARASEEATPHPVRVYTLDGTTEEAIRSELWWLDRLREDVGLMVPEPISLPSGERLLRIEIEGQAFVAVRFGWIEGDLLAGLPEGGLDEKEAAELGELMARLHRHSRNVALPNGFERRHDNWQTAFGETSQLSRRGGECFSPRELELFETAGMRAREVLADLGEDAYGLIHGELKPWNVLISSEGLHPIDFCECRFGYYAYDFVGTLGSLPERLHEPFRGGYGRIQALPAISEALEQAVRLMDEMYKTNWILSWPSVSYHAWGEASLREQVHSIEQYLAG